jgi:hypothetical protein
MECWSDGSGKKSGRRKRPRRFFVKSLSFKTQYSTTPVLQFFNLLGRVKLWQVSNVLAEDIYRAIRRPA